MEYEELSKLFYMSARSDRHAWLEREAQARRSMPSSFDVGLDSPNGRLFVASPCELTVLQERILRTEIDIAALMKDVSGIARAALIRGLVLDEVVSTNAIEDIHSTRAQVKEALESFQEGAPQKRRFRELANIYLELGTGSYREPRTPQDIRLVYDKITEGEIPEDQLPDGKLFRAEGVNITAGGVRVVHTGLEPEGKIIETIELMLDLLDRDDIPAVTAAIVSHYLFEYAHPFYDGNGRTGRYLLSLFLRRTLSFPTVLSLSRAIAGSRDAYYRAFKSAETPMNKGELTFFVFGMMELIRIAQTDVVEQLDKSKALSRVAASNLENLAAEFNLNDKEADIAFVMAQYELFETYGSTNLDDISQGIGLGRQMTRKHLARLEDSGAVVKTSSRPLAFSLSENAKAILGI